MSNDVTTYDGAGTTQIATVSETAGTAMAAQAKALVEARFTVALRFPRNEDEVRAKVIKEAKRTSFARVAIYSKPVAGKKITGPSIRFAEALIRIMKNIDVQTPTIYDDAEKRIVRVTVGDLESNTAYSQDILLEKTVERKQLKDGEKPISSRLNSYGDVTYLVPANEDQLLVKQAALISKAIRTLGLRLVPGDLIDEALFIVKQTMEKEDFQDPDAAKRRLFDSFDELGVTVPQLVAYLGHDGAKLNPKELADLRAAYAALKDGETTWKEIMELKAAENTKADAKADDKPKGSTKLKEHVAAKKTPAAKGDGDASQVTALDVIADLSKAKDEEALEAAWQAKSLVDGLTQDQEKAISIAYTERLEALNKQ